MALTERENFMRNASLQGHEWIPFHCYISGAYRREAGEDLDNLCVRYPALFPGFRKPEVKPKPSPKAPKPKTTVDDWGCGIEENIEGMAGLVVGHPLEDWAAFATWSPPPVPQFTEKAREELRQRRARGEVVEFGTGHGFFFMRLYYLRGFENFMMDVAAEDPQLDGLVETIADYWEQASRPYVEAGIDVFRAADDLGTQTASMLGPAHFRRWLMPTYKRLFLAARRAGTHVFMHHDGYVMDIMDEIIESGASIVNPQDLVNGVDNLAGEVKGRVSICLDIDRQQVLPFGSPNDVKELVKEEVLKLGSPAGGLELVVGLYPPTPLENVEALFSALDRYRTHWVGR